MSFFSARNVLVFLAALGSATNAGQCQTITVPAAAHRHTVKRAKSAKPTAHIPKFKAVYGPPMPPDRAAAAEQARLLVALVRTGHLRLANAERDFEQIHRVARDGQYTWPPATPAAIASSSFIPAESNAPPYQNLPSRHSLSRRAKPAVPPELAAAVPSVLPAPPAPALLRMLTTLAANSRPSRPLEILSLFRPPYRTAYWQHGGPGTLHAHGMAADIAAYGGCRIQQSKPEECVAMTLALLRDLPPGHYRLGLPKAPETPLVVGLPPSLAPLYFALRGNGEPVRSRLPSRRQTASRLPAADTDTALRAQCLGAALLCETAGISLSETAAPTWAFFPAPQPELAAGVVVPLKRGRQVVFGTDGLPIPNFIAFRNEAYAQEEAIGDVRVRTALQNARWRGVDIIGVFPDAADHIHVDVKPQR